MFKDGLVPLCAWACVVTRDQPESGHPELRRCPVPGDSKNNRKITVIGSVTHYQRMRVQQHLGQGTWVGRLLPRSAGSHGFRIYISFLCPW